MNLLILYRIDSARSCTHVFGMQQNVCVCMFCGLYLFFFLQTIKPKRNFDTILMHTLAQYKLYFWPILCDRLCIHFV